MDNIIFFYLWGIAIALVIFMAVTVSLFKKYTEIVKRKNEIQEAFSDIDVQLKKRYDLVPNLVAVAQKYMEHEEDVLKTITETRSGLQVSDKLPTNERFSKEDDLAGALKQLNLRIENYPDLKADKEMLELQKSLVEIEDYIAAARRFYNTAVNDYNDVISIFPGNLLAFLMGMKPQTYFSSEKDNSVPNISSSTKN
jgi:LemA protein